MLKSKVVGMLAPEPSSLLFCVWIVVLDIKHLKSTERISFKKFIIVYIERNTNCCFARYSLAEWAKFFFNNF